MRTRKLTWLLICLLILCNCSAGHGQQVHPQSEKKTQDTSKTEKSSTPAATEIERPVQTGETPKGTAQVSSAAPAEHIPRWLQRLKTWTEAPAYLLAFLFFLYKLYVGQFTTNLTLSIACKRLAMSKHNGTPGKDQLAVVVTIKKGENGLIKPLLAQVRVLELSKKTPHEKTLDLKRVSYKRSGVFKVKVDAIEWDVAKEHWPLLNFPPGDGSQFACYFEVSTGELCQVDVVLMGKRRFKLKTSQWRASDISLPSDKQNQPASEVAIA